ncbi:energy transducer TonB [Massilia sp. HP4]|uniref:energy transducer TonB n=1 Tax=Massilia sp. HP4 TaxID=2562316 RepID=UPI001485185A|nr:energy transducer TonB [Massilia sp. HP4]
MSRNTPLPGHRAPHWKAALPILALALLAGCAQTAPVNPFADMPDNDTTSPVMNVKSCRQPVYPESALAAKVEGTVKLAFLVKADGTVREAVVRKTSGNATLDETARAALAKCRFQPGTVNGAPKEQWTESDHTWKIEAT